MARVNIPVQELIVSNEFAPDALKTALTTAINAADGAEIVWGHRDEKMLVLIENAATSPKTVTVKAGNGIQGCCDIAKEIAASSYTFLALDSGRFKNVSGADKGKVIITGASADIKVAVFKLP